MRTEDLSPSCHRLKTIAIRHVINVQNDLLGSIFDSSRIVCICTQSSSLLMIPATWRRRRHHWRCREQSKRNVCFQWWTDLIYNEKSMEKISEAMVTLESIRWYGSSLAWFLLGDRPVLTSWEARRVFRIVPRNLKWNGSDVLFKAQHTNAKWMSHAFLQKLVVPAIITDLSKLMKFRSQCSEHGC